MPEEAQTPTTVHVDPVFIPWGRLSLGTYTLNSFQEEVLKHLKKRHDILAVAPTGGGKTLTLLLSPGLSGEDMPGFVAIYPNNTLLKNQMETVKEIVEKALGGRQVYNYGYPNRENGTEDTPPLTILEISGKQSPDSIFPEVRYVALVALSGRYILSETGVPKREVLYRIAEKVYEYDGRGGVYVVVFATPDTFLLVYTGAYRDFSLVGMTLHNILTALASGDRPENLEDILRKTGVLSRPQVSPIVAVAERLLAHPLFIDEFHLYDPYEVDALHAIISLFKLRTELPIVFSSATPAKDIMDELSGTGIKPVKVEAEISNSGFPVRGPTTIHLLPIFVRRKGFAAYYRAGEALPEIVLGQLLGKLKSLPKGRRALIILDRLWMVTEVARGLHAEGLTPHCIASLVDEEYCSPDSNVIVGSEATTQGVNLGEVVLGITGGVSGEDVIQRIGRVGRKGISSEIYLALPYYKLYENPPPKERLTYRELVEWILSVYPDYSKRKRSVTRLLPDSFHETRRKLLYSLGIASLGRVAGNKPLLKKIRLTREDAARLLESVVGSPDALTKLVVFRRTGFTVDYIDDKGMHGSTSIGLIARNYKVARVTKDGAVMIKYVKSRYTVAITVRKDPGYLKGKFVELGKLLQILEGSLKLESNEEEHELQPNSVGDVLVYVGSLGRDLADYISYTGEGAVIRFGTRGDYGAVFI